MPRGEHSDVAPAPKRRKTGGTVVRPAPPSRIFAPYRTIGLISPTSVPFTSIPLGKTTFQLTTSTGRTLHTYDLRRGLQLVFITRPETPAQITATTSWKEYVIAAWGSSDANRGVWVFKRGQKVAELETPPEHQQELGGPIRQIHIFGAWVVGAAEQKIEVWRTNTWEHHTTLYAPANSGTHVGPSQFSGPICSVPTLLNKALVGHRDGSVAIFNVHTGKLVYTIPPPGLESGEVTALCASTALGLVAIARSNDGVRIHDVRKDKTVLRVKATERITSVSFRTDGIGAGHDGQKDGVMATASEESGDVTLWDLNERGRVMGVLRGAHNPPGKNMADAGGGISKIEFLPGQPVLMSSGRDNALKSWIFDESPFNPVPRPLHSRSGHAAPVSKLHFLPVESDGNDAIGKWLLSASRDRSLWGWSLRRDGQSTELSQGNIRKKAKKLGFDGKKLEMDSSQSMEDLKAPEITCMACNLNRDGGMGASTGGGPVWANMSKPRRDSDAPVTGWESVVTGHRGDKFARTWFWGRKKAGRWAFPTSDGTEVKSVAMSPCGTFALVGSAGGGIDMFNLQSGIHRRKFPSPMTPAQAKQMKLKQLQLEDGAGEMDLDEAAKSGPGKGRHTRDVTSIVVDNTNRTVISCGLDGRIKFWDLMTGTLKHELNWHPMAAITECRHHRKSDLLALSCDDLSIRVVDIETGKLVRELWGCVGQIKDLCFSNDSRWIVATSMDSVIRVWDLPTGHLIDAVHLDSVCTSLSFSPTGEFLATSHAESIGISVWSNRALFKHVSTRHIQEEDLTKTALPTDSGEGAQPLLAAAFEEEEQEANAEDDAAAASNIDQLNSEMTTLSLVPRSRWQTLLHLDLIAARNKPTEAPKAPEKAPFFLPSLEKSKSAAPVPIPAQEDSAALAITASERSRISALQKRSSARPFTALLHAAAVEGDHEPFISHMKTLSPSAADVEIRGLRPDASSATLNEYAAFVRALTARLRQRRDYELLQAWMAVLLRIHGQAVVATCRRELEEWRDVQREERERIGNLVGYCGGVVQFLRSTR